MEVLPILKEKVAFLSGELTHDVHHTSHEWISDTRLNSDRATAVCGRNPRTENRRNIV